MSGRSKIPKQYKTTANWDAELDRSMCDSRNNCEIKLTLKVYLEAINPPTGAASGTYPDASNVPRTIIRWNTHDREFVNWKQRFTSDIQNFWDKKLRLKTPAAFSKWDYNAGGQTYRPNVWCRFRLKSVDQPGLAHLTVKVVHLAKAAGSSFQSYVGGTGAVWDNKDGVPQDKTGGVCSKQPVPAHEVGHLLGLPHVNAQGPLRLGWLKCKIDGLFDDDGDGFSDGDNAGSCYGVEATEICDVMGGGGDVNAWHAMPWQEAATAFSGLGQGLWEPVALTRYYPRTLAEVQQRTWPTRR